MSVEGQITVALGEYDIGWHDPAASVAAADRLAARAAALGATLIVLPETATTGFTMDASRAVPLDSPDVDALRRIATRHGMWVLAGIALRIGPTTSRSDIANAAIAIDPTGNIAAVQHKRRLSTLGKEDSWCTPGKDAVVVDVGGLRLGMFICYELRFPEVFAAVAPNVDAMALLANWPTSRQQHWEALLQARAIENQCFMIGVNRTGNADGLEFAGGSVVFDAWGTRVSAVESGGVRVATIRASHARDIRSRYPFLRDRQA